jgi:hypothetical protein
MYQETFPGVTAMAKLNSKGYGKTQLKKLWQKSTQLNSKSYGKTQPNSTQKAMAKLNPTQLKKLWQNSTQLNSKCYGKTQPNSTQLTSTLAFMNYFWGCSIVASTREGN